MPTAEGEIGSVATVHFDADATARSVCHPAPAGRRDHRQPARCSSGDEATLTFTVSNPGTGVATGVVLEERVPAGLQHPAGSRVGIPDRRAEARREPQAGFATDGRAGRPVTNLIAARATPACATEHRFDLEVVAPQLDIALAGPEAALPRAGGDLPGFGLESGHGPRPAGRAGGLSAAGLKFVGANNAGHYDEATRAVSWRLEELPANQTGHGRAGHAAGRGRPAEHQVPRHGRRGLAAEKEQPVLVEGIAAVLFQVAGTRNPIEVGGETTYEVRVVNQGSKAAGNVRVAAALAAGVASRSAAEGPTRSRRCENGQVVFEGLAQLAPKADALYRVRVPRASGRATCGSAANC